MSHSVPYIESTEQYNQLVQNLRHQLIVLDMTATFCGACKTISPHFTKMQFEYPTVLFRKVDVDDFPEIADAFDITALPTFIFIRNGKICDRIVGANLNEMYAAVEKHM